MSDNAMWLNELDKLEVLLHARARGPTVDAAEYVRLRRALIGNPDVRPKLPKYLLDCTNVQAVWVGLLSTEGTYRARDAMVTKGLAAARRFLEGLDDEIAEPAMPDMRAFLHTLRSVLEENGKPNLVPLLLGVEGVFCERKGETSLELRVPIARLGDYDATAKHQLALLARPLLRSHAGRYLARLDVVPQLEAPPDESEPMPGPTWKPERLIKHDRLHFRSKTEVKVYEALKRRNVFFFVNATAVLGGKFDAGRVTLREPDFLICQDGKWGILEPGGDDAHPAQTAMKDHDRARLFNDYGVRFIQFYDAPRCYSKPDEVVNDFLKRLAKS